MSHYQSPWNISCLFLPSNATKAVLLLSSGTRTYMFEPENTYILQSSPREAVTCRLILHSCINEGNTYALPNSGLLVCMILSKTSLFMTSHWGVCVCVCVHACVRVCDYWCVCGYVAMQRRVAVKYHTTKNCNGSLAVICTIAMASPKLTL